MRRFAAFGFSAYYPSGGWRYLVGSFDTVAAAIDAVRGRYEKWHVVDLGVAEDDALVEVQDEIDWAARL